MFENAKSVTHAEDASATRVIGTETTYIGTEHEHLRGRRVRIYHVLRPTRSGAPALMTDDDEFGGAVGVRASDRIDVAPLPRAPGASRAWDVPARDLERFAHLAR